MNTIESSRLRATFYGTYFVKWASLCWFRVVSICLLLSAWKK